MQSVSRDSIRELHAIHAAIGPRIESQIVLFKKRWLDGTDEELFAQLVFCLLTPQSKARRCGEALEILISKNLLFTASASRMSRELNIVRFKNKKAIFIERARNLFFRNGCNTLRDSLSTHTEVCDMRRWLVGAIAGYGYKEASHFLRNIGFGDNLAILDRHILRNLHALGVINAIPAGLSTRRYSEIETEMRDFSRRINIPLDYLDFILWYKETNDIYQ